MSEYGENLFVCIGDEEREDCGWYGFENKLLADLSDCDISSANKVLDVSNIEWRKEKLKCPHCSGELSNTLCDNKVTSPSDDNELQSLVSDMRNGNEYGSKIRNIESKLYFCAGDSPYHRSCGWYCFDTDIESNESPMVCPKCESKIESILFEYQSQIPNDEEEIFSLIEHEYQKSISG